MASLVERLGKVRNYFSGTSDFSQKERERLAQLDSESISVRNSYSYAFWGGLLSFGLLNSYLITTGNNSLLKDPVLETITGEIMTGMAIVFSTVLSVSLVINGYFDREIFDIDHKIKQYDAEGNRVSLSS